MQFDTTIPIVHRDGTLAEATIPDDTEPAHDDAAMIQILYPELRRLARAKMALLPARSPLQATALVHEVYLRLCKGSDSTRVWTDRKRFLALAARIMWCIIVDHIRHECAQRRGGGQIRVTFTDSDAPLTLRSDEILYLEQALKKLHKQSPELAEIVLLRFVSGLTMRDIADQRRVSERTVQRQWQFARAWLHRELAQDVTQP